MARTLTLNPDLFSGGRPAQNLLRREPTIDDQARARHKAGVVRGKENDTLGDVLRCTKPAHRMTLKNHLANRIDVVRSSEVGAGDKDLIAHVSRDDARMDRVHPAALGRSKWRWVRKNSQRLPDRIADDSPNFRQMNVNYGLVSFDNVTSRTVDWISE